jgi:hypothetical protein
MSKGLTPRPAGIEQQVAAERRWLEAVVPLYRLRPTDSCDGKSLSLPARGLVGLRRCPGAL